MEGLKAPIELPDTFVHRLITTSRQPDAEEPLVVLRAAVWPCIAEGRSTGEPTALASEFSESL